MDDDDEEAPRPLEEKPEFTLESLPPLPEPEKRLRRSEARLGCCTVLSIIALVLGLSYAVPLNPEVGRFPRREIYVAYFFTIHACALLALICLERILRGDPGVIARNEKNCFPIPDQVKERLREGRSLDDLRNVYQQQSDNGDRSRRRRSSGSSYCVRCLVWRPPASHHCATCQRCVQHFDHHCAFYGRCIAGTWRKGNMPFFAALIFLGYVSVFLFFIFAVWALANRYTSRK